MVPRRVAFWLLTFTRRGKYYLLSLYFFAVTKLMNATNMDSQCCFFFCSVFGEDALVNLSVEKKEDSEGELAGYIRIRSKTQGIALSLGDRITMVQRGTAWEVSITIQSFTWLFKVRFIDEKQNLQTLRTSQNKSNLGYSILLSATYKLEFMKQSTLFLLSFEISSSRYDVEG